MVERMDILVTGAAGFIGKKLAFRLAESGAVVHAFCYTQEEAQTLVHPNIKTFLGDVLDKQSINKAMFGCHQVYHLAAFAKAWVKDVRVIHSINVTGTLNVLDNAQELGVAKVVVTSSAGVIGPSRGDMVTEKSEQWVKHFTEYEKSKSIMEERTNKYVREGLNVVIVNPTRVYGPGLLSESNAVTRVIKDYMRGKWRIMPGNGRRTGNYAFIDDVVTGHVLAMKKGMSGERYILGGENQSYESFFQHVKEISKMSYRLHYIPYFIMLVAAYVQLFLARVLNKQPQVTPGLVKKYLYDWDTSSSKAIKELGYEITPLPVAVQRTINWLRDPANNLPQ